jgi:hypothetical protein
MMKQYIPKTIGEWVIIIKKGLITVTASTLFEGFNPYLTLTLICVREMLGAYEELFKAKNQI